MNSDVKKSATDPATSGEPPAFALPALPYGQEALEPYVSARTMSFHYAKHHRAYVDNLNKLVAGAPWAAGTRMPAPRPRNSRRRPRTWTPR